MVSQSQSKVLRDGEQLQLLPSKKPCPPVDLDYLKTLPSFRRAVRYSVSLADLEPKQICDGLDMDTAIWSRISNGGMSFPADEIPRLRQVAGNNAPLLWLIHQDGFDITRLARLRDDRDRRIEELETRLAERERDLKVAVELISGRIPR